MTTTADSTTERAAARILLVDDDAEILRVFRESLEREGYDVVVCFNGAEACEKLRTGDFEVLITDMVMSPVPGEEVLRFAAEHAPDTETIMITGFATFERLQAALRRRVFDCVEKPVDLAVLCRTVAAAVSKTREKREKRRIMDQLRDRNRELADEVRRATAGLAPETLEDAKTGLPGYQAFRSFLETEISTSIQTGTRLTLGMIQPGGHLILDGRENREEAEALLREVGEFLRNSIRRADAVFRYGARQFAIVFPESGCEGVTRCVERLVTRAASRKWGSDEGESPCKLTFSAGLASAPADAGTFDDLVRAADRALERAVEGRTGGVRTAEPTEEPPA